MAESASGLETGAVANGAHPASAGGRANLLLRLTLGVAIAAFVAVVIFSLHDPTPKEGGVAPAFSLVTDSGRRVTVNSFGGKVLVLNFWATWCAPCVEEIPSLNAMQKRFSKDGLVVVAVSIDKNGGKYRAFLDRIHVAFDTARDPAADVSSNFGTFQYPETYIIRNGRILRKFPRAEDWMSDDMTRYLASVL